MLIKIDQDYTYITCYHRNSLKRHISHIRTCSPCKNGLFYHHCVTCWLPQFIGANMAIGKTARIHPEYSNPNKAVNGNGDDCMGIPASSTTNWVLDLGEIKAIGSVSARIDNENGASFYCPCYCYLVDIRDSVQYMYDRIKLLVLLSKFNENELFLSSTGITTYVQSIDMGNTCSSK